ncbi:Cd(II)/Pb(II)-responsive transcriptional regulator [Undibacterium fentianense]|uniref:Cd(II)/Pb(II)-responsive transcriptional regulator n=1 Tax=Undibacterium fentianense TaxID=2828728 RepID=UPI002E3816FC|nr:Cd(II)/Pb(II)-responsive transcriptional regulator [Undibacterium fentianense]
MELKIGELAKRSGCQVETIRFYEKEGLLPPAVRSQGNYRLYSEMHAERLQFIRHCRSLDMTLHEIRQLLQYKDAPQETCVEVNYLLDKHIEHVAHRITELLQLQKQLTHLRSLCDNPTLGKNCGILHNLATTEGLPGKNLGSHRGGCH